MARLGVVLSVLAATAACLGIRETPHIIDANVIVIGGGAGGAHAALQLKDLGQNIVLVEKRPILGGCVNSYTDPVSGKPIDYGVYSFVDYANATEFFARLNIPTTTPGAPSSPTEYVDFTTGKELTGYLPPNGTALVEALETYLAIAEKYEDMLVPGYWNFPNASDIPDDLLMNFGDFATKYGIEAALPIMFITTALGVGKPADELTMTVMQAFGGQMARSLLGLQATMIPASHRNQDVYDAIARLLGDDVLYNTTAIASNRTNDGVTVTVKNHVDGTVTTLRAPKLLIAINPVLDYMAPFELDAKEYAIFSKWQYSRLYAALVKNPSLTAANETLQDLPVAAEPTDYLRTPSVPFVDQFQDLNTPDSLYHPLVVGNETLDNTGAQHLLQSEFKRLVETGVLTASNETELEFAAWSDHGAMHLRVTADDYRAGFVQEQYALQGHRSTWYTGGGYASQFQTIIWAYNDVLISKMLAS